MSEFYADSFQGLIYTDENTLKFVNNNFGISSEIEALMQLRFCQIDCGNRFVFERHLGEDYEQISSKDGLIGLYTQFDNGGNAIYTSGGFNYKFRDGIKSINFSLSGDKSAPTIFSANYATLVCGSGENVSIKYNTEGKEVYIDEDFYSVEYGARFNEGELTEISSSFGYQKDGHFIRECCFNNDPNEIKDIYYDRPRLSDPAKMWWGLKNSNNVCSEYFVDNEPVESDEERDFIANELNEVLKSLDPDYKPNIEAIDDEQ